jgi:non-specific serine/threonine protein kinase
MTVGPLAEALAGHEVLVVLDNCEHLLDGVPQVSELLAATPRLRILATSRERLHLTVEREYPLPPLPMPAGVEPSDLDRLRDNPAIALLLARAPAAVQLTARTSQALADICVRLDGLPLAIELAAARLRVFTPSELAFRLEHSAAALSSAVRDRPGRHRDILSAIAWSHDLLPENERVVFRRASVFVGSWTLADVVAITPGMSEYDVVAAVESLLDKSLVRRSDVTVGGAQEARFSFLFSVREYAAARLDESGETDDARRNHLRHFAEVAVRWERTVGTQDEALTFAWTEQTRLDLLAALEYARQQDDVIATLRLATALGWYWYTRGSLSDVASIRELVARAADGPPVDADLLAAALVSSGVVCVGLGERDAAERDLTRAVALCRRAGDDRRLAIANAFLGHALRGRGDYAGAAEHYGAARRLWAGLASRRGMAWSAHDLGILAYETGDYAAAEALLREALLGFREIDYPWAVAVSAWGLGATLIAARRPAEAAQLLSEALVVHDAVADRRGVAQCLESLASLAVLRNDAATAGRLLGAAEAWRTAAAARRSRAEQERVVALDERITQALGRGPADAERLAGRTLAPIASIALAAGFAARAADQPPDDAGELTARQRDVAALVAAGHTNRQIGRALGISEKTAEVHVRNIMERLNTPSRAGVAAWAASRGLAAPPG